MRQNTNFAGLWDHIEIHQVQFLIESLGSEVDFAEFLADAGDYDFKEFVDSEEMEHAHGPNWQGDEQYRRDVRECAGPENYVMLGWKNRKGIEVHALDEATPLFIMRSDATTDDTTADCFGAMVTPKKDWLAELKDLKI